MVRSARPGHAVLQECIQRVAASYAKKKAAEEKNSLLGGLFAASSSAVSSVVYHILNCIEHIGSSREHPRRICALTQGSLDFSSVLKDKLLVRDYLVCHSCSILKYNCCPS